MSNAQKERETQPDVPVIPPDDTCNARKRVKKGAKPPKNPYCSRPAGWGTDHDGAGRCKLHGGNVPNHRKSAQIELARAGVQNFGLPVNIEPHEALLQELARTNGIITFYEAQIQSLKPDDVTGPIGTEGEALDTGLSHHPQASANIFIKLHAEERKHLIKVADTCIRAGIAERQIELAEAQGAMLAGVIRLVLQDLSIDLARPEVRESIRNRLLEASQQSITVEAQEITNGGDKK